MNKKILFIIGALFCFGSVEIGALGGKSTNETIFEDQGAAFIAGGLCTAMLAGLYYYTFMPGGLYDYITTAKYAEDKIKERFDSIPIAQKAIDSIKRVCHRIKNVKKYSKIGSNYKQSLLLHGPSKDDQKILARALAGEVEGSFVAIESFYFSQIESEAGANITSVIYYARNKAAKSKKPVIVFIESIQNILNHPNSVIILKRFLKEIEDLSPENRVTVIVGDQNLNMLNYKEIADSFVFKNHIHVGNPDRKARLNILKELVEGIESNLTEDDLKKAAKKTEGFTLKGLKDLINTSAILAVEKDLDKVSREELTDAWYEVLWRGEKDSTVLSLKEEKIVAYHESGHALVSLLHPEMNLEIDKITICPQGDALGFVVHLEKEDQYISSKEDLLHRIRLALGGCAAEELAFGLVSTGPSSDLKKATEIARKMILKYGMTKEFGRVFNENKDSKEVDALVKNILEVEYENALNLLKDNIDKLDLLASTLLERKTLYIEEVYELLEITPPITADFVMPQAA